MRSAPPGQAILPSAVQIVDTRAQDLWAAILANPEDDGPRLVLADHWIALGDPRGELITVQCALTRAPGDRDLLAREQELLPLTEPSRRDLVARARQHRIHRGFIDDISFESPRFDLEALRLVLTHPEIRPVRFLEITRTPIGEDGARAIADAIRPGGALGCVRALTLSRTMIGDAGAAIVAPIADLERLHLDNNDLRDTGATAIAEQVSLTIRELELSYNRIGEHGAAAIAESPRLAKLEKLWLIKNPLGPYGVSRFIRTMQLPGLTFLDISWCGLGEHMAAVLATPHLAQLKSLDLCGNAIGERGVRALVGRPLPRLERLQLGDNHLTDGAIDILCAHAHHLPALRQLSLENNPISDRSLDRLEQSPLWSQLAKLHIYGGTQATYARLEALSARFK